MFVFAASVWPCSLRAGFSCTWARSEGSGSPRSFLVTNSGCLCTSDIRLDKMFAITLAFQVTLHSSEVSSGFAFSGSFSFPGLFLPRSPPNLSFYKAKSGNLDEREFEVLGEKEGFRTYQLKEITEQWKAEQSRVLGAGLEDHFVQGLLREECLSSCQRWWKT